MRKIKSTIIVLLSAAAVVLQCRQQQPNVADFDNINFRPEMRNFVIELSSAAKKINSNFLIIPQNGQELITQNGEPDGELQMSYLEAIDVTGREDLFYGYDNDNASTPADERAYMLALCRLFEQHAIEMLVTDYCWTQSKMDDSYQLNAKNGFISFAAPERDLNTVPTYPAAPFLENDVDVTDIAEAKNFLYLINSEKYNSKTDFVRAVAATNYDIVIMDLFHNETAYTQAEIQQLRTKGNGGRRLVICYLSIGEAEDYRYYWQSSWNRKKPVWLLRENPNWHGNYKVAYWDAEWQKIIFAGENSYLQKILDAGFDGAYLDLIDAFEYFED